MSKTIPNELKELVLPAIEQQVQIKIEEAFKLALYAENLDMVQRAFNKVEETFLSDALTPDMRLESLNETPEVIAARNLIPNGTDLDRGGFNLVTGQSRDEVASVRKKAFNNKTKRKYNKGVRRGSKVRSSAYKGVDFNRLNSKWRARISFKGKNILIGHFDDEMDAARAYDKYKFNKYGEIHGLNFPNEFI